MFGFWRKKCRWKLNKKLKFQYSRYEYTSTACRCGVFSIETEESYNRGYFLFLFVILFLFCPFYKIFVAGGNQLNKYEVLFPAGLFSTKCKKRFVFLFINYGVRYRMQSELHVYPYFYAPIYSTFIYLCKCTLTSSIQRWSISGLHLGVLWMISEEE